MSTKAQNYLFFQWLSPKYRTIPIGLAALLFVILAACSPNGAPMTDKKRNSDSILQTHNPDNPDQWTRIIVRLNVEGLDQLQAQAAKLKDPAAAKAMDQTIAQRISAVADRVLKRVKPTGARLIRRYDTLPLLALQVPHPAMAILKSMSEVQAIEVDTPSRPAQ